MNFGRARFHFFKKQIENEIPFFFKNYFLKSTNIHYLELDETTRGAPGKAQYAVLDTQIGFALSLGGDASGNLRLRGFLFSNYFLNIV